MNIFATYPDPQLSAIFLDDKRVRKMLLESVQLLCGYLYHTATTGVLPYKPSHNNHPAQKWVNENYNHARWLFLHASYLAFEVEYRFGRDDYKATEALESIAKFFWLPASPPLHFYRGCRHKALGIDFTKHHNVHKAYRKYLRARWPGDVHAPKWTKRASRI